MTLTIAVAQLGAKINDTDQNIQAVLSALADAREQGVQLTVFPECILTGYLYDSAADVQQNALNLDGPEVQRLIAEHKRLHLHSVIGLLEAQGTQVFNTSLLIGPAGIIGVYRKQHLPFMGADRFVSSGPEHQERVWQTDIGRIGMLICFDIRFPESARELALKGADIIAMPTNWALQSDILADHFTKVRAVENLVYLAVANRNDQESGMTFMGHSQIVSPRGQVLQNAETQTGLFSADIDVALARTKHIVVNEGTFELPIYAARRPRAYATITDLSSNQATNRTESEN